KKFTRKIRLVAVSQMAAVGEIHRQHLIARLEHRKIDSHVRAAARMRLDVGMFGMEELERAFESQLLNGIDVFASAIPTLLGITYGIFVRKHRSLRFQNCGADEILARDQLDIFLLPLAFRFKGAGDEWVLGFES